VCLLGGFDEFRVRQIQHVEEAVIETLLIGRPSGGQIVDKLEQCVPIMGGWAAAFSTK